jgi:membrane protein DedA with SNARE-associated domain
MTYLVSLFEQHSYLILFLGIFLELMALPISGEFLMSYAGYFVFQGKMNYILALLTVFAAGGAGITVTYWIGKAGGYKLIEKYGKYIHLGPERYAKTADWFERSGSKLLLFAYFIPGVRHFTGYISGISRMPFRKFFIPAYIGSFIWGVCFITLGKVLGPKWQVFHQAASKYFVIIAVSLAILIIAILLFRFYKNQLKTLFTQLLRWLVNRLQTIRKTEVFLIVLTLVLIGLVSLMLGMAQDYLFDEFTKFNEITKYVVQSVIYQGWMKGFLSVQSPYVFIAIIGLTAIFIWKKGGNRLLEYLLLIVSIAGARLFNTSIQQIFFYLQSIGFFGKFHSTNFPDFSATLSIIVFGSCIFLLVRHSKSIFLQITLPSFALVLLLGLTVARIALSEVFASDIMGGYVYGSVWIFFNFLFFEMLRLVVQKDSV